MTSRAACSCRRWSRRSRSGSRSPGRRLPRSRCPTSRRRSVTVSWSTCSTSVAFGRPSPRPRFRSMSRRSRCASTSTVCGATGGGRHGSTARGFCGVAWCASATSSRRPRSPAAITETVAREGLREFYDPHDGRGMGAEDFAWSALALELLDPSNASVGVPAHGLDVEGSVQAALDPSAQEHHARRALSDAKRHLQKSALKLAGYLRRRLPGAEADSGAEAGTAQPGARRPGNGCSGRSLSRSCPSSGSSSPGARSSTRRNCSIVTAAGGEPTTCRLGTAGRRTRAPRRGVGRRRSRSLDPAPIRNADQADRRARVQPQLSQHRHRRTGADRLRCRARDRHLRRRAQSPADAAPGGRRRYRDRRRVADRPLAPAAVPRTTAPSTPRSRTRSPLSRTPSTTRSGF